MENMVNDVRNALEHVAHSGAECNARFRFSPGLSLFKGHFPGDPVLPGVLQIEMIRAAVDAAHCAPHRIAAIKTAKFRRPIRPDEEITLHVALSNANDATVAKGTASVGEEVASQITLHLHPMDAGE